MSYFPRSIMPLTPKEDAPLATGYAGSRTRLTSSSYNTHDQEIRAIEQFVGASDLFATGQSSASLLQKVSGIIDGLNAFSDPYGGVAVSSGNVKSGGRIIFPEPSLATYLVSSPGIHDGSLTVNSTSGFPESGVLSILNDMAWGDAPAVGHTNVEWIKYSSKTPTAFKGCERGYGGTMAGTHAMTPTQVIVSTQNVRDYKGDQEHVAPLYDAINVAYADAKSMLTRHFPGWRRLNIYEVRILGLYGTIADMTWKIARRAAWLSVKPSDPDFQEFSRITGELGILRQRNDGTYYLESNDIAYAIQGILTWEEASAATNGLFVLMRSVNEQNWPAYAIPVFCGRLSLTLSVGEAIRDSLSPVDGVRIRQNASGEAYVYVNGVHAPTYGDVSYHALLVSSRVSAPQEMDKMSASKGILAAPPFVTTAPQVVATSDAEEETTTDSSCTVPDGAGYLQSLWIKSHCATRNE